MKNFFYLFLLLLSVSAFYFSQDWVEEEAGAKLLPRLWAFALAFLALLHFFVVRKQNTSFKFNRRFLFLLTPLLYVFSIDYLGYYLASILFLGLFLYLFEEKSWKKILPISLGWALFAFILFEKGLGLTLPEGIFLQ